MKTGRNKNQKKKTASKSKQKRGIKTRVSSFKKRKGKDLFDLKVKSGFKDEKLIQDIIDKSNVNFSEFPDTQVKITMYASKGLGKKNKASMSFIYDLEEGETKKENTDQLKWAMKDMLSDIFRKKTEREKTKSWQRIQPIKNYINKITIDFRE